MPRGAERYLAWRAEMRRARVPDLVHVRCGPHQPELLMRTDSPLALNCLFETFGSRAPWIELSELPGDPREWPLVDSNGKHYLGELAVSWFRDGYWEVAAPG